jgi:signal transduction histidine kinase
MHTPGARPSEGRPVAEPVPRVLVVDSEPKARETVAGLLRIEGYDVETAAALPPALDALAQRRPDVLLTELSLAEVDLLDEVRRRSPGTACVVLTGYASLQSAVAALRRGAYDYLIKPCVVEDLKQTVARAVAQRRANLLAAQRERQLQELNDRLEERVEARTAELAEANHRLEEANAAKDHFLATLSHELRTPLTPLRAALDLIKLRNDASLAPLVESMEHCLDQETRLIDDLLDMARVTAGKLALQREAVDLAACLRAAVETIRPRAEASRQEVKLSLGAEFPPLFADPVRLRQVACNLLENASKFSPEGGRITVAAHRDGPRAVVEVADCGPGIDPAFLPHVFKPFRQADSSSRRQHGGLGLGLAIARQIVELHGGEVRVANRTPPPGACFTFAIPIVSPPARPSAVPPADVGRLRVLLVDDSVDTVAVLSRLLEAKGLLVSQAVCVAQALDLARAEAPDVVITDIGMPEQDGYDLLRLIREDGRLKGIPVIAATGYVGNSDQAHMAEMGFAATLSKPFDLDELLRTLGRVCRPAAAAEQRPAP